MSAKKTESTHDGWRPVTVDGRPAAVCTCGVQSPMLPSTAAAGEWHAAHVAGDDVEDEDEE